NGPLPFTGAIVTFQIGTPAEPLMLPSFTSLEATPVDIAISPQGYLYAALQLVTGSTLGSQTPGLAFFTIDPTSGQLGTLTSVNSNLHEDSLTLNPGATVLFDGEGSSAAGLIESQQIRSDGTTLAPQSLSVVSPNSPPSALLDDGSGHLLFVQQGGQTAVYTIDQITGALAVPSTSGGPVPFNLGGGATVAHPVEPYFYTLASGQVHVFEITDFTSGALREITSSPYTVSGAEGAGGLTLTHDAASQSATATAAQLVPSAINFVDTTVGQSVSDNSALLTNAGTQALTVTISITGADQADFNATTCPLLLAARTSCPITVTFTPTQAGARQATLVVAASAGPQTLLLTGNGVASSSGGGSSGSGGSGGSGSGGSGGSGSGGAGSGGSGGSGSGGGGSGGSGSGGSGGSGSGGSGNPQPTVAIAPASLSFSSSAQGTASSQLDVTITNSNVSANAQPLVISSLQIAGLNATDFAIAATCVGNSVASGQGCTVAIVFTPGGAGNRVATLVVTDNAANSPQLIALNGAIQSELLTISAGKTGLTESVTAGQTADFSLTVTPGFTGTVSFSPCSGAPTGATCTLTPAPMPVIANQPLTLTVSVATVASGVASRGIFDFHQIAPIELARFLLTIASALLLAFVNKRMQCRAPSFRSRWIYANTTAAVLLTLALNALAGCGGASTVATAPAVTPTSQTYTIIITPTATTTSGASVGGVQPIQLTLVVN
ncbi:MAG: choice-of-anchor D domain-containing protein, partial [Acidobacteria bacterium]|nr:choice-of-anchor D domain-containing protein [Acidobacteriota bacterium]